MAAKPNPNAPLGQGGRFAALQRRFSSQGKKNPAGLAAYIGKKKYGSARFNALSRMGKKK